MTVGPTYLQMRAALGAVLGSHGKRLLTSVIIVGAIVAACGGSAPDQAGSTPINSSERGDAELGLTEEEVTRRVDAVESLVATCMTNAGFEYVPVDYATARAAMDSDSKPSGLNADEFRTQFGYGISTLFAGTGNQATLGAGEENILIRENLTVADRVAYVYTLYGENPSATFVVALDEEDFSNTGGCTRSAVEQVFSSDELAAGFVNYDNAAAERVDQDPRVVAAYVEWANCMIEAGYTYAGPDEIGADLASRLDNITGGADPETLAAEGQAALSELQGEERAIAAADNDCELKFVDPIKTTVQADLFGPNATGN